MDLTIEIDMDFISSNLPRANERTPRIFDGSVITLDESLEYILKNLEAEGALDDEGLNILIDRISKGKLTFGNYPTLLSLVNEIRLYLNPELEINTPALIVLNEIEQIITNSMLADEGDLL